MGQIRNIIDPSILYGNSYITRTSTSPSGRRSADIFLDFINSKIRNRPVKTILEIGCNDLYTLQRLKKRAEALYGIDPILKSQEKHRNNDKIKIIGDFFENVDIKGLNIKLDLVLSSHTLEHIEDPKRLMQKMFEVSSKDTLFFFQFPGLESLVKDAHFDQIFHQHYNYFSLQSILHLLNEVGGELFDFQINPYHWGTLMIAFKKKTFGSARRSQKYNCRIQRHSEDYIRTQYGIFLQCMEITAQIIDAYKNRSIYGYGAASMLPVLEYYLDRINAFRYIIDDDPTKKDLYYLNVPVQIKPLKQINDIEKSVVVVTAVNSLHTVRSIVSKLVKLNVEKIILPMNLI